ncbi:hypothetical protein LSM04_004067 [Trypanosoma melophagium]|nr:hypothetical protein LSM04_004067 [Trypanosoma melophagium]
MRRHTHRTQLAARQRNIALMEERNKRAAAVETAVNTAAAIARETAVVARKDDAMSTALQQAATSLERCRTRERELRVAQRQGSDIAQQALEFELMREALRGEMRHLKLRRDFLQRRKSVRDVAQPEQQAELEALVRELARLKRETEKRKDGAAEALREAKRRLAESKAVLKRVTEEVTVLRQLPPSGPIPDNYNREMAPTFLPVLLPEGGSEENQGDMGEVNVPAATQAKNEKEKATAIVVDDDDDLDLLVPTRKQQSKQQPVNTRPTIQFDDDDL